MTENKSNSEIRVGDPGKSPQPADGLSVERLRTIVQDAHLNFLFGAGTSSPYFEQLGAVEFVLTALGDDTDEARLARASVQGYFFEKVLLPNVALIAHEAGAKPLIKSYARFVGTLNRILLRRRSTILSKQANLFTTNVDMAFEVALELLEVDVNDGFSGKINPRLDLGEFSTLRFRQGTRFEYRSEIPVLNLFKIHGSAAWRQDEDDIYFDHRLELIKEVDGKYQAAKADLLAITSKSDVDADALLISAAGKTATQPVLDFIREYERLSIVNPEKTKFATTVLNQTYYELLRRLANELEKENGVLVVHGFSFRDEHLLDLVLRSAATNPTLQVIVFCHSRDSHGELIKLFPQEKIKNGNILLVKPSEPEGGEDERKLSLDVLVDDYLTPILSEKVAAADHIIELKLTGAVEESEHA